MLAAEPPTLFDRPSPGPAIEQTTASLAAAAARRLKRLTLRQEVEARLAMPAGHARRVSVEKANRELLQQRCLF